MYTYQTLPKMHGPPLRLMIEPPATAVAIHTPLPIPLYCIVSKSPDPPEPPEPPVFVTYLNCTFALLL